MSPEKKQTYRKLAKEWLMEFFKYSAAIVATALIGLGWIQNNAKKVMPASKFEVVTLDSKLNKHAKLDSIQSSAIEDRIRVINNNENEQNLIIIKLNEVTNSTHSKSEEILKKLEKMDERIDKLYERRW
jgi:carboxylesterase type B